MLGSVAAAPRAAGVQREPRRRRSPAGARCRELRRVTHQHTEEHDHGPRDAARDAARLRAWWPFVAANLPSAPASVLEIGCGPLGGFVPAMNRAGYDAIGVDPEAPEQ